MTQQVSTMTSPRRRVTPSPSRSSSTGSAWLCQLRLPARPLSCTAASLPPQLHEAAAGPEAVPSYSSAQPLTPRLRRPSLKRWCPSTSSRIAWEMPSPHRLLAGRPGGRPAVTTLAGYVSSCSMKCARTERVSRAGQSRLIPSSWKLCCSFLLGGAASYSYSSSVAHLAIVGCWCSSSIHTGRVSWG